MHVHLAYYHLFTSEKISFTLIFHYSIHLYLYLLLLPPRILLLPFQLHQFQPHHVTPMCLILLPVALLIWTPIFHNLTLLTPNSTSVIHSNSDPIIPLAIPTSTQLFVLDAHDQISLITITMSSPIVFTTLPPSHSVLISPVQDKLRNKQESNQHNNFISPETYVSGPTSYFSPLLSHVDTPSPSTDAFAQELDSNTPFTTYSLHETTVQPMLPTLQLSKNITAHPFPSTDTISKVHAIKEFFEMFPHSPLQAQLLYIMTTLL